MTQADVYGGHGQESQPGMGMAITAFVFSIVGIVICGPLGLVGLILGIVALMKANETPPRAGGKGFAVASIAIGGLSILLMILTIPLLIGIMLPALGKARESAHRLQASSQIRMMCQGLSIYASQNDGIYPATADGWQQLLIDAGHATPDMFVNPRTDGMGDDFFYVPGFTDDFSATGVLVYEDPAIDPDGTLIGFRDSHVEYFPQAEALRILSGLTLPDGTPYAPHIADVQTFFPPSP